MPSKEYLLNELPLGDKISRFNAILEYAKENHDVTGVVSLTYVEGGFHKVVLRNLSNEEFSGDGSTKTEAIADCVSAKYPG